MSPDSSKEEIDLDFPPMFITAGGEESREQHNLKERKRRSVFEFFLAYPYLYFAIKMFLHIVFFFLSSINCHFKCQAVG